MTERYFPRDGDRVTPRAFPLTHTGNCFESCILGFNEGWNDLPPEKRLGTVREAQGPTFMVDWDNGESGNLLIFWNEVDVVEKKNET